MRTTGDKGMTVKEAAQGLGKSQGFVRAGLQFGIFPFGTAIKLSNRWTFYISPKNSSSMMEE